jgi:hypothetical protein
MSYCQRCGEKNKPGGQFCGNCGAPLPIEQEPPVQSDSPKQPAPKHEMKLDYMPTGQKLSLLGKARSLYLINLLLVFLAAILMMKDLFSTDLIRWQTILGEETGLFGPDGKKLAILYFLLLSLSLIYAACPLYTRNTYNTRQLLPAMALELVLIPTLLLPMLTDGYFGLYLGTTLTQSGKLLLLCCVVAVILQGILIGNYRKLKRKGVYTYVPY